MSGLCIGHNCKSRCNEKARSIMRLVLKLQQFYKCNSLPPNDIKIKHIEQMTFFRADACVSAIAENWLQKLILYVNVAIIIHTRLYYAVCYLHLYALIQDIFHFLFCMFLTLLLAFSWFCLIVQIANHAFVNHNNIFKPQGYEC